MAGSENADSVKQTTGDNVHKQVSVYEEEINLIDYFLVLWKHKRFILLASMLPTLVIGLAIFLWPRDYKINYTYNIGLDEKAFNVLEDTFYSTENLDKFIERLRKAGFNRYAKKLTKAKTAKDLKEIVSFTVLPSYFKAVELSKVQDFEELAKLQSARGNLLITNIIAKSAKDIREIAQIHRENFEHIMPLYSEKEQLNSKIMDLKRKMADIEEVRYQLSLNLERNKSTLEKLKNTGFAGLDKLPSDIILQFNNVGENSAFLPLAYQVQAAETQIINLEEQIRANKEMYSYYTDLLKLNEKLFNHLKKSMMSCYTLGQFHVFLTEMLAEYKEGEEQLTDYLNAYIKRIENKIADIIPLVEKPKIYPVTKGTVKKSAVVFVIALMMSVFSSFLLESLKKRQVQAC